MSNSFYNFQKVENGQNISSIPLRNFISNKCFPKKYKNKILSFNGKIQENNEKNHSQIILNSENIISNDDSKYIHCKRHPKNIISFFCQDDRTFPCILCISNHEEHAYKRCYCTKKYFNQEMLNLKGLFEDIEIKYFQYKKIAENFFSKIKIHFDKEINKINEYFDSMISILQDKKNEFIAKMLIIYENYLKKFINYKFVFDSCDKNYYNLNKKINYIENEIYKKEDFESFYNIKNIFINEINDFSKCNDDNFRNNNNFYFNDNSMPIFSYPEKPIINGNDNINLFGSFKNINIDFNQKENGNEQRKIKEKIILFDSINIDNALGKNNNNVIKKNKTNLEILDENTKNKNIISSINSQISNINDTLLEKQLIDTNSTLFLLNKNEVKNVFKQQDEDTNQILDLNLPKKNNNEEIRISESPKNKNSEDNKYKKVKYTSCDKEKRNKQIIKKFLEKEELNRNDISRLTTKQSNLNREKSTNYHSKYFASFDNNYRNKTLNDDNEVKRIKIETKNKKKNKKYPPNNYIKYRQIARKKSNSITKNINSFNIEQNNNNKKKKTIPKKEKINNINKYINDSFERENVFDNKNNGSIYIHRKINCLYNDLYTKNKSKKINLVKNQRNVKSMKHLRKNRLNYIDNNILNNMPKPESQICRLTDNYNRRNSLSNYNINRSNSYRYYKKDIFLN